MTKRRSITSQTIGVSILSVGSLVVGFASSLVTAYLYGASQERDAFLLAMVIPSYVATVFTGTLSLLFTPIFIEYRARDKHKAWQLASSVVCATGLVLFGVTLIGMLAAPQLTAWLAPRQARVPIQLTGELVRILMPTILFSGIAGLFASLHYSEHRFIGPTVVPILSAALTLTVNVLFNRVWGIRSLAVGSTLGSIVSALILAVGVVGSGNLTLRLNLRDEGLWRLFRASLPLFLAGLLYRFNTGFERLIGAALPTGSISFMGYATQLTGVLTTMTSSGLAVTIVPLLSRSWAEGDFPSLRRYLGIAVRTILLVCLPIVGIVLAFGSTFVSLAYERGAFGRGTTEGVAQCLSWLMAGYVASNLGRVVTPCFYVTQRTTFLAAYTVVETLAYLGLAIVLTRHFSYLGLAAATSARDTISVILYLFLVARLFHGINAWGLLKDVTRIVLSASAFLLTMELLNYGLADHLAPILVVLVAGFAGALVYGFMVIWLFRMPEALRLVDAAGARSPLLRRWAARLRIGSSSS